MNLKKNTLLNLAASLFLTTFLLNAMTSKTWAQQSTLIDLTREPGSLEEKIYKTIYKFSAKVKMKDIISDDDGYVWGAGAQIYSDPDENYIAFHYRSRESETYKFHSNLDDFWYASGKRSITYSIFTYSSAQEHGAAQCISATNAEREIKDAGWSNLEHFDQGYYHGVRASKPGAIVMIWSPGSAHIEKGLADGGPIYGFNSNDCITSLEFSNMPASVNERPDGSWSK